MKNNGTQNERKSKLNFSLIIEIKNKENESNRRRIEVDFIDAVK